MALAIEDYGWFNLQLTRADIAFDGGITPKVQEFPDGDLARNLAHDICLEALHIAFNGTFCADDYACIALDVATQDPIDPYIAAADDIPGDGGTGTN